MGLTSSSFPARRGIFIRCVSSSSPSESLSITIRRGAKARGERAYEVFRFLAGVEAIGVHSDCEAATGVQRDSWGSEFSADLVGMDECKELQARAGKDGG